MIMQDDMFFRGGGNRVMGWHKLSGIRKGKGRLLMSTPSSLRGLAEKLKRRLLGDGPLLRKPDPGRGVQSQVCEDAAGGVTHLGAF